MPEYKVDHVRWLRSQAILRHRQQEFGERDIFNAIADELEDLQTQIQDKEQQYFEDLRHLCGYIEDGTDTSITIGQDDATKEWPLWVKGGKDTLLFSPTFSGLIKAAHDYAHREDQDGNTRNG